MAMRTCNLNSHMYRSLLADIHVLRTVALSFGTIDGDKLNETDSTKFFSDSSHQGHTKAFRNLRTY